MPLDWLRSRIARDPRRTIVLGKSLLLAGGILILGAVFARIALINFNAERTQASLAPVRTLAQAYPQYLTWPVPEGPVGFVTAAVLVVAGLALIVLAEQAGGR